MKYLITFAAFFCFFIGFSQDFKQEWKEVIQLELDGKIKSADEAVDAIYKKAKRKDVDDQIIKCFFYQSKFIQVSNENAHELILKNLLSEIKDSKGCKKALLNYIYITILEKYAYHYRYQISQLTQLQQNNSTDLKTWTAADFQKKINELCKNLLRDENDLRSSNIREFASIFEISPFTDTKKMSVYDFLLAQILNREFVTMHFDESKRYQKTIPELFKKPADFVRFKADTLSHPILKRIIELYQHNEMYCLKNKNEDIAILHYNRIKRFSNYLTDKSLFFAKLTDLETQTDNAYLIQDIRIDRAKYFFSITEKGKPENHYPETLAIIETVLNSNENPNAKVEAETLKEKILGKKMMLNMPSQLYENQNYRAFIEYKNIDTLQVRYYRITVDLLRKLQQFKRFNTDFKPIDRDSLVFDYIEKHQAYKAQVKVLPATNDHFDHSTEILMENLDLGNYLLFFETKNPLGYPQQRAFAYHTIQVSNMDFIKEVDLKNDLDVFQVLNRKTGQPMANATVKNDDSTSRTDANGQAALQGETYVSSQDSYSDLFFINEKDTLYSNYYKHYKYERNDEERFEAKPMLFFDRAIYRPGQKVYFKGFLFKNQRNIKSVVPFVTVHVTIIDADDNEVKELDIQTNEFGSFTGEYDIPKNVLTGEFYIAIDEPDAIEKDAIYYDKKEDEHRFWDAVDFNGNEEFKFKVEEYKRPTFEVSFDKIKENYTIGDTITIRGNAKTLAGSNLTNAKVSYKVADRVIGKTSYYHSDDEFIESETTTDGEGNFKIEFIARPDDEDIDLNEIETLHYTINASVTDLNGETRTGTSSVNVGDKMLNISGKIAPVMYREDKNTLEILATTLNNFPIKATGTITFIAQKQEKFLIKRQRYPELPAIERKEFERLFPYEAYEQKDAEIRENKVLTLPFDTEKTTKVDLSFLKDFESEKYKILFEAKDQKGNLITHNAQFELGSKTKKASKENLFTFNQVQDTKDHFVFEINSIIPNLYISARMFHDAIRKSEVVIQLKNGFRFVKFPKKGNYDNIQFHFSTIWENTYYSDVQSINKEEIQTRLEFEINSMRNKIEPGSKESWSFIIRNSKMQSEVLASMYDASLDQFASENWTVENFYRRSPSPSVSHEIGYWYDNNIHFRNLYFYSKYYKTYISEPQLDWFGFDFISKNNYLNKLYLEKAAPITTVPRNAKTVFGVVADSGGPIPGVNVLVKGTTRRTQTDFDGYYEIDVEKGETLEFSFLGYSSARIMVDKDKKIDVLLKDDNMRLEEVVVTGYNAVQTKAKSVSASITRVSTHSDLAYYNIEEILAGKVAGINIEQSSGAPGAAKFGISIRGIGSLSNSEPLYVVDGVPIAASEFRNLNPNDIKNLAVLKDASATAIYGSRGANGVIIINTKNGLKELEQVKTRTNFNETAFFYPNLTTDADGRISFSFTTPESLTKWKLRMLAHNKKAETGYFESEIISQKDIMVMPNMPRFVREKDTINLAVKVVNLTHEVKSGNAILMLFDAATNNPIDAITLNRNNTRVFSCKAKQSVVVNWKITIPDGIQGVRYKVIAKSGNLSDGEENILPVLTDKILVTESVPIWVKGNTKREFTLPNLKNNTSSTLQNHAFTLEYTSNPVWLALQSLPYLMVYEHDCAEQTFAKYYANCLAEKIIAGNPKIEALFKKWKDKSPESKLKLNEELKSIVLAETPWLMDAESEEERNNRLAVLMDLNTLRENNEKALKKVEDKLLPSGGFAWFNGGNENRYISQHILAGIGHLNTLFPADSLKYKNIVSKGVPNMDRTFVSTYTRNQKMYRPSTVNLNYLYTRSFYFKNYPLSKKCDSLIQLQIKHCKEDWLGYSLYEKGLLALVMNRFNEKDFAKKIINSLKETVSNNEEIGMYWIENNNGYDWYQSSIETQALLIEAFAEIDKDRDAVDAMKVWLIKKKQTKSWPTTKATTEAVYALLYQGSDWTSLKENTKIRIGDEKVLTQKLAKKEEELDSGYLKIKFEPSEINSKMGTITIDNKTKVPGFGGAYWQYFETLENIKSDSTKALSIDKKVFKKVKGQLVPIAEETLKVGDLLTVRLIIRADSNLDFVHLKDLRASCLEPVDVISGYEWKSGLGYYKSTKDVATHFFFDVINKGPYVLEYDLRVTNTGAFNNGISTLQSMYAPEFGTHSVNTKITVSE
ncbi:alpha-2-macroglobulin family protein [Flavobacterium sp.]